MANFDMNAIEQKYEGKTVLAISLRIVNQLTAEKLTREKMFRVGAKLPPANVHYQVYWFPKKLQRHPIRTYVVYNYPAPPEVEGSHLWNAFDLEDSFNRAHGKFYKYSIR